MFRPGEPLVKSYSKVTCFIDPFDWLPEELYCSGFRDSPTGLGEKYGRALRNVNSDPPFPQPPLQAAELGLQVFDEKRGLTGRGYDGRIIRIESQLHVAGRGGHVVYI